METVIYVDILFIINFVMDGLCMAITMLWLSKRPVIWRLLLACAMGGSYSVAVVAIPFPHPFLAIVLHLLAAYGMTLIAMGIKKSLCNTLYFFFANALLGGVLYGVFTLCGCFVTYNGAFYAEFSVVALIACGIIAGSIILYCLHRLKAKGLVKSCELRIEYRGKCCTVSCLLDSGNLLTCPFTALPVAIISKKAASGLFTENELRALASTPVMEGVRPLPVKGIGGNVLLPSFTPSKTELRLFGEKHFTEKRLCIALQADDTGFHTYDGIVPVVL